MKKLFAPILLIFLISTSALATTVERLTLDDMVRKAQSIVHAKVRGARTHWSANGKMILTTYTLEVEETMKGQASRTVELTTIGGKIGDLTLYVSGMPAFQTGEDAVVFIEKAGVFSTVVGLSQGKFAIEKGEVSNTLTNLSFPDGRSGVPLKMRLAEFKREISNRLH
jgi:hypothetical protein